MNFDKPSPLESSPIGFSSIGAVIFCIVLEAAMFTMFFALYVETIGLMNGTLLSELPVIGPVFEMLDPDANASHIIAALLSAFSVATPLFIWGEIFQQKIFDDPQEWFAHPQNQIIAVFAALILALVIGLELVNLYTLIAKNATPSGFIQKAPESGLMAYLAENRGMGVFISAIIAVINIVLALFSTRAIRNLKSIEE